MTEASVCYNSTLVNTVSNICWKKASVTLVSKNGLHSKLPLSQGCLPSVLWHCWLGSRKGIRHVKKLSSGVLAWLSVCSEMHMAQRIPLPLTVLCFSKIQTGFTFLVLAHPGSSGQRAVKRVCVCVCVTSISESSSLRLASRQSWSVETSFVWLSRSDSALCSCCNQRAKTPQLNAEV